MIFNTQLTPSSFAAIQVQYIENCLVLSTNEGFQFSMQIKMHLVQGKYFIAKPALL